MPELAAVASVKGVGRLYVDKRSPYSPWNIEDYVLTGGRFVGTAGPDLVGDQERTKAPLVGPTGAREAPSLRPALVRC
jgi:hypothetical protein